MPGGKSPQALSRSGFSSKGQVPAWAGRWNAVFIAVGGGFSSRGSSWCWDPPVCGEAVRYSTLWCRYPIAMGTPQHARGGLEALSAWRTGFRPRLLLARSPPEAQCMSAGSSWEADTLGPWLHPWSAGTSGPGADISASPSGRLALRSAGPPSRQGPWEEMLLPQDG
ncbi:unnamed protein product [Rangifer tarandus platyrhynchus]|uniref:Uncharacterized protein n=1 Tax=Rangifer tarandus platyrhynchus TaxID=3082113 RepID=A0AC59ZF61_RANTA